MVVMVTATISATAEESTGKTGQNRHRTIPSVLIVLKKTFIKMAYLIIKSDVNVNIYVVKMNKYCSPWIFEFFFPFE